MESSNHSVSVDLTPSVYPNPSSGTLNFELQAPDHLTLSVEVYSLEGRLVKSFAEKNHTDGFYKKNWLVENHLSDGIYYVFFKTNFGTFQEKIVISKGAK